MDTRAGYGYSGNFGPPYLSAGAIRPIPLLSSSCGIPATAKAYSLNVTVVPFEAVSSLTLWPTGQGRPGVHTLVEPNGRVVANNAIITAGVNGSIDVYATGKTDLVLDINGYFSDAGLYVFYPLNPCRIIDTRPAYAPPDIGALFGAPSLAADSARAFPVPSGRCPVPAGAKAYFVNITAIPTSQLGYITAYPTATLRPYASTLNSWDGRIVANGAIVPADPNGSISLYASSGTDVAVDILGYFATDRDQADGLALSTISPCRVANTFLGSQTNVTIAGLCGVPSNSPGFAMNVSVQPSGPMAFLSVWPAGQPWPVTSLLDAFDGGGAGNAAIIPSGSGGAVAVLPTTPAQITIDVTGYFARAVTPAADVEFNRSVPADAAVPPAMSILADNNLDYEKILYITAVDLNGNPTSGSVTRSVIPNDVCQVNGTTSNIHGVSAMILNADPGSQTGVRIRFRADPSAGAGIYAVSCRNNGVYRPIRGGLQVYNVTPELYSIDPMEIGEGVPTNVTFYGTRFGTNVPKLVFTPSSGITYTPLSGNNDSQFTAAITAAFSGTYNVQLESQGNRGMSFQGGTAQPAGGGTRSSQQRSGSRPLTVKAGCYLLNFDEETSQPVPQGLIEGGTPRDPSLYWLPIFNPTAIIQGETQSFQAIPRSVSGNCAVTWSITTLFTPPPGTTSPSGGGAASISGVDSRSPADTRRVSGLGQGWVRLGVTAPATGGGQLARQADVQIIPVAATIPVRLIVLCRDEFVDCAAETSKVLEDFEAANRIWSQVGIRFILDRPSPAEAVWRVANSALYNEFTGQTSDPFAITDLFLLFGDTGGFKVYYIPDCTGPAFSKNDLAGFSSGAGDGAAVCMAQLPSSRVMAHELGHTILGGNEAHRLTPYSVPLMFPNDNLGADLNRAERELMLSRGQFQHQ